MAVRGRASRNRISRGHFVGRQSLGAPGEDRRSVRLRPRLENDESGDDLQVGPDGELSDADFGHGGMQADHALDLVGRDPVAESVHQIVVAPVEPEVAVLVQAREIAAREPFAAQDGGFFVGPVPVAEHQARLRTVDGEKPGLAFGQRLARPVHRQDRHAAPGLGHAGGTGLHRNGGTAGDVGRDFAHAERLVEGLAGPPRPGLQQVGGQGLASGAAVAQPGQIAGIEIGIFQDLSIDARHGGKQRRTVAGDETGPDGRITGPIVEHARGAAGTRDR